MPSMSKTEALIGAVQRFWLTPRVIKLAFVLINCAYLFFLIGFSTNGWVSRSGQSSSYTQGLFNHCVVSGIFTCCQTLNSHLSDNKTDGVPAWIDFTRVILCFGLISSTVAMMYICSMMNVDTENLRRVLYLERACYVTSYMSGVFLLLGSVVYGSKFGRDHWQSGASLHGSYGVTTVAGILFVLAGIATSVTNKRNRVADVPVQRANLRQAQNPIPPVPPAQNTDENVCCVCLEGTVNVTFLNCGHTSCCYNCANNLKNSTKICPICRQTIRDVVRIFRT
ncbi:uncharacterized protein LOC110462041 [Mizuhopecten yessoensis]|uniref:Baculoviral IAP repeat-containing protein 3 n=1 Tax=Mizuhopecten yessoensis TaxID=6573 RepID=A0A210PYZ3_MIZYE|nr:uncharacterized protein LOC110462041 [Mizuhopecten yessoensis]OWF41704.1 Baculoviral IAP repeat-containing protein 3 [Mizuhopecten yessoensis]